MYSVLQLNSDSNLYKTNNQSLPLLYRQVYFKCDWCPRPLCKFCTGFFLDWKCLFGLFIVTYLMTCTKDFWKNDLQA